ncbi:hypothetical protein [Stigmatella erecta]|uniref:Uncharacterized protein n=1 Tax=Stigmatella erecta TaxID=83460 RepID=A0A1I0AF61_9BACT|nr:hypothetical protein [Stigmatella erecta]SES92462.1 hypothetical protein SAMN05443639_101653 [Stigmatella erecta]
MLPSNSRSGVLAVMVMASCLLAGCASNRREAYLQDKAAAHVYRQPIAEVWSQAKALLSEEGYSMMEAQGRYEMQTEWLMLGAPSSLGTTYARYLVRGGQKAPGQTTVVFHRQMRVQSQGAHNTSTGGSAGSAGTDSNTLDRDHAMEWKLLQRVDAEAAKALEAEAARNVP